MNGDQAARMLVCICGATADQHQGNDPPFIEKAPYDAATWKRALYPYTVQEAPGTALYVQVEDQMQLVAINTTGVALEIDLTARILLPNGTILPIRFQFLPTSVTTPQVFSAVLTEGFLLSVTLTTPTAQMYRGGLFCVVTLMRGAGAQPPSYATLISDYLVTNLNLGWPGGTITQGKSGFGNTNSQTLGAPGAGAEISFAVPAHTTATIHSIVFSLTTSVAGANREVTLVLDDTAVICFQVPSGFIQTASLTHTYCFALGVTQFAGAQALLHIAPLVPIQLPALFRLRTVTTNLQAADQYSTSNLFIEKWAEN